MDDSYSHSIEQNMMKDDARFMVGLLLALRQLPGKSDIPYLLSCLDFHSFIMYETYNYYVKRDPARAAQLQHAYEDDIKQSRQRMKLYGDKKLGIDGIGKTLLDTITPAHQEELSKTHRIKLPKWAWKDIGLYFVEGSAPAVGSTHLASFNMGIDITRMFDPETATGFGKELGRFFIAIAGNTTMLVRLPQLNVIAKDTRSEKLYTKQKYGSSSKVVNAGLSIIDMNSNFVALCLPPSTQHPPIFKWKFLTAYHVILSLRMLCDSPYVDEINRDTMQDIEHILDTDFARLLESAEAGALRNTLTHYGIDTRLDTAKLNMNSRQYYGLIEASLPGRTYEGLAAQLDMFIRYEMLNIFHAWD